MSQPESLGGTDEPETMADVIAEYTASGADAALAERRHRTATQRLARALESIGPLQWSGMEFAFTGTSISMRGPALETLPEAKAVPVPKGRKSDV